MKRYLYRVQIIEYPAGAWVDTEFGGYADPDWQPEGWKPTDEYIKQMHWHRFIWPSTAREWRSRASAVKRRNLIESFGAKAIIQRSSPIEWPVDGEEKVS